MKTVLSIVGIFVASQLIGAWIAISSGYTFGTKDFGDFLSGWSVAAWIPSLIIFIFKMHAEDKS